MYILIYLLKENYNFFVFYLLYFKFKNMNDNWPSNELNKWSHPDNNSSIGGAESQWSNLVDENKTSVKKVLDNGGQIEEEQLEYVDKVLNNGVDSPLGDEIIDLKDPIINGNQKTEKSEFIIQDLNEIRNLKLSDINIEKFFYNILKKDIDNPNTFIDIFKKIINDELISKTEMELIWDVWTSEFYKNLLHNVVYKGNRNLIKKLIPALHDQINKLLREFSIKKVKSSIDW